MSRAVDDVVLTISPEMVRINSSMDADWVSAFVELAREAAAAGQSVRVLPVEITYTPAEAARMVDVSKATVLRRIKDGTVKASKRGAHYRVPASEVERYRRSLLRQMATLMADDIDFEVEATDGSGV
ncbi:MAG: helix-turn-helix domain-containing protein [Propionibacteriaceae bacterium]|jgi:excisionase family DNA binding protein|nr:helix-turn-helix domain-containing protein [Propionibacteriaceae bacterium]